MCLIKIPVPYYFVLYNGVKEAPDRVELKLSEAVNRCIEEGHLEEYLRGHLGEAKDMLLSGFDEEIWKEGLREEGREEGKRELISEMLRSGMDPQQISDLCKIPLEFILDVQEGLLTTK